ncbi:hypothetical protein GGI25_002159 [Coemansia spiralis]|uniref:Uncharacterized protein n=2 Tax=Coemansia TaxID=4863 RepID=A0A9W8GAI9_9FUNG|nr:hypothetical protein GGI25_002159 [Coemansia spiralis]
MVIRLDRAAMVALIAILLDQVQHQDTSIKHQPFKTLTLTDPNKQSPLNTGAAIVYKTATSPYSPNGALIDLARFGIPLPTNRWWGNLIIAQGLAPIHPYPYRVACLANASTIGFPKFQASEASTVSSQVVDWTIGDASGSLTKRLVTDMDALGVQVT